MQCTAGVIIIFILMSIIIILVIILMKFFMLISQSRGGKSPQGGRVPPLNKALLFRYTYVYLIFCWNKCSATVMVLMIMYA